MLGSDFELFMKDGVSGEFVPEFFLNLPDKGQEHVTLYDQKGTKTGYIHRDNVSVELCTLPTNDARRFAQSVEDVLVSAQNWLTKTMPGLLLGTSTTVRLNEQHLGHPHAQELGCDIDFVADAVGMQSKERDALSAAALGLNRHSGGHVHVSYAVEQFPAWIGALICDLFLGMPMISHLDRERAMWYGNASLHRATRYPDGTGGVEYRPLDSGWVHSPETRMVVGTGAAIAQDVLNAGSNDLIAELMRVRAQFPAKCMLIDVSDDQAKDLHYQALKIASNVSANV